MAVISHSLAPLLQLVQRRYRRCLLGSCHFNKNQFSVVDGGDVKLTFTGDCGAVASGQANAIQFHAARTRRLR